MTNLELAQDTLSQGLAVLELQPDVRVSEIKGDRWTLVYDQNPLFPHFGQAMIKLEKWIRAYNGSEVELMCEAEADKNKRDVRTGRGAKMVNARNVEKLSEV